jgi:hypothetical protein
MSEIVLWHPDTLEYTVLSNPIVRHYLEKFDKVHLLVSSRNIEYCLAFYHSETKLRLCEVDMSQDLKVGNWGQGEEVDKFLEHSKYWSLANNMPNAIYIGGKVSLSAKVSDVLYKKYGFEDENFRFANFKFVRDMNAENAYYEEVKEVLPDEFTVHITQEGLKEYTPEEGEKVVDLDVDNIFTSIIILQKSNKIIIGDKGVYYFLEHFIDFLPELVINF